MLTHTHTHAHTYAHTHSTHMLTHSTHTHALTHMHMHTPHNVDAHVSFDRQALKLFYILTLEI